MKTSANGVNFIKQNEGFSPLPTNDNGRLMWGYGHDRRLGESVPASISPAAADALLVNDLALYYEPHVNALAPWANQNQFDALTDFCYNEGPEALATMLHHGQAAVPVQMTAWCYEHVNGVVVKSSGLLARREKETALYLTP
jgi:GH24 family phage-related lysozyme (muramidase)